MGCTNLRIYFIKNKKKNKQQSVHTAKNMIAKMIRKLNMKRVLLNAHNQF